MEDRILFIVFDGEIKFSNNPTMDHREWYLSLGGNIDNYDNVIRGYIMNNSIIFFKANLNYDNEVIDFATKMGLKMKNQLKRPDLKICCGINPGQNGAKWEPILVLNDTELEGYKTEEQILVEEKKQEKIQQRQEMAARPAEPIIEFKNNADDSKFIRYATIFTLILIGVATIIKIIMIQNKTLMLSNRWNSLLLLAQMGLFILTIVGYNKKMRQTKYFAIAASIISIFMFDIADIIIGVLNFLFTIDQKYIMGLIDLLKKIPESISKLVSKSSK